jgi:hypothetical protein
MATTTTTRQREPPLSGSPAAGNKRQRNEQHKLFSTVADLPTTGYDVLLVGETCYTQVLAKALLQAWESSPSSSYTAPLSSFNDGLDDSVDRLAVDALLRTLSNSNDTAASAAIWKRRHVHMVESLSSSSMSRMNMNMNHVVIVVPTAFSADLWETVPVSCRVQQELDKISPQDCLRQRVSIVAIVRSSTSTEPSSTNTTTASSTTNINSKAHSHVPLFLCHEGQNASFNVAARQLWKRTAIGMRTDPVSTVTVSPLLLASVQVRSSHHR